MVVKSPSLLAPFDGPAVPLRRVPDPVFAGLMMGDGLALEPLSDTLLAPCDGEVAQLARTGHALTLRAARGEEVLIHIGIDTVKLEGEGFDAARKRLTRNLKLAVDTLKDREPLPEALLKDTPGLEMFIDTSSKVLCFPHVQRLLKQECRP